MPKQRSKDHSEAQRAQVFSQPDRALSEEELHQAQLSVCSRATDTDDARILLDMLGLVLDPVRFPVTPHRPNGGGSRAPHRPPSSLPASGYGAVS